MSWLTRKHLGGASEKAYVERIDLFEQRLCARLVTPPGIEWTYFKRRNAPSPVVPFHVMDHPAAFDGGDVRYLVTQPYIGTIWPEYRKCPKVDLAKHWADVLGFDEFEALDPAAGFWNPPGCHVFVFTKRRP